jgi:hypothetical protein
VIRGVGDPYPYAIYRGLPPIKLLLFRAFPNVVTQINHKLSGLDTTITSDVQGPILESLGEIEKLA